MNISAYLISVARTVIPSAWGALISWAVYAGLLSPDLQASAEQFATILVGVVIALYYALVRLAEAQSWWPAWLSAVLLGAPSVPSYAPAVADSAARRTGDDRLA
jgi:hypothetical protein